VSTTARRKRRRRRVEKKETSINHFHKDAELGRLRQHNTTREGI
jgi:hypothetical protein